MATKITEVRLLAVPLENDYKHTLYFNSVSDQTNYFTNLPNKRYTDFSYQRKEGVIRIPDYYDNVIKYNYVMYKNSEYSNKWFYAFITDYEFKGDDQTNITIETDVMQSWLFDYTVKPSFVEREHTDDDTEGNNTLAENLEVGEYTCVGHYKDDNLLNTVLVMAVTEGITFDTDGKAEFVDAKGGRYNGIYSGLKYYAFNNNQGGAGLLNSYLVDYAKGHGDAIQSIFIAPKFTNEYDGVGGIVTTESAKDYEYSLSKVNYPYNNIKNKKLLTYPYRYLLVSNNAGGSAIYKFERFNSEAAKFKISGALTPGGSVRMIPLNYNGATENDEEGINLGKYPICNWSSDVYTNWLTQNAVNIGLSIGSGAFQVVGGAVATVATGGIGGVVGAGSVASGIGSITNQLAQIHQMSFTPPQSHGNTNCGDVVQASNNNTFHFYEMVVKEEYARIIDDYFTMFGYKTNLVKVPNKNHRKSYWFTKTIDVNIIGTVPQKDLQIIKNCYNNGITFWKNNIKDYSVDNSII